MKDKCAICGESVGNNVFTICDDCWEFKDTKLAQKCEQLRKENEQLKKTIHEIRILSATQSFCLAKPYTWDEASKIQMQISDLTKNVEGK